MVKRLDGVAQGHCGHRRRTAHRVPRMTASRVQSYARQNETTRAGRSPYRASGFVYARDGAMIRRCQCLNPGMARHGLAVSGRTYVMTGPLDHVTHRQSGSPTVRRVPAITRRLPARRRMKKIDPGVPETTQRTLPFWIFDAHTLVAGPLMRNPILPSARMQTYAGANTTAPTSPMCVKLRTNRYVSSPTVIRFTPACVSSSISSATAAAMAP